MQLDYVDIVFSHRPDYDVSLYDICKSLNDMIEKGYTFYWGTSEWRPEMIVWAIEICLKYGWHPPWVEQTEYNVLSWNRVEYEYDYL